MRVLQVVISILALLTLLACSDAFIKTLDDYNAELGGERVCKHGAAFRTESYSNYSYETGGLCNLWKGRIINNSNYTIKCDNYIDGVKANPIYALGGETTEAKNIGYMSGVLSFVCMEWELEPFVSRNFEQENYQLLMKVSNGVHYIALQNTGKTVRYCSISDENNSVIYDVTVEPGEHSDWLEDPVTDYFTWCTEI